MAGGPVLDSDVLIDYLRGAGPGCDLVRSLARGAGYRVTAVTAFELALGRSYRENPRPVHVLLSTSLLTLTRKAGLRGGALLGELRRNGVPIDVRDAMQAGICLEVGATLVTRNISHFERVPGLRVQRPEQLIGKAGGAALRGLAGEPISREEAVAEEGTGWAGDLEEIRSPEEPAGQ